MKTEKKLKELETSKVSPIGGDLERGSSFGGDLEAAVHIRRALKSDCPRLMELILQLAIYERAPNEVTATLEHFEESGFVANPVWWAFVAEIDGIVQGFALYYLRYSTWKGQRMYLEDFIVNEELRGNKIGKLLFDRLIEEAKEKNLSGIVWQVLDWNEPAINFYKKYDGVKFEQGWLNCSLEIA